MAMSEFPFTSLTDPYSRNSKMDLSGNSIRLFHRADPIESADRSVPIYTDFQFFDSKVNFSARIKPSLPTFLAFLCPSLNQTTTRRSIYCAVRQEMLEHS